MTKALSQPAKPFLRWAGSKRKQLPVLEQYWSDSFDRYVEPFAGSACFFFKLGPSSALIADKNNALIETFESVRSRPSLIYDRVTAIPRTKKRYYEERNKNPKRLSQLQRAVRFIYLNRNCFNGIYRTNLNGDYNVPFASSRVGQFVTKPEFLAAATQLKTAEIRNWDFGMTLRHTRKGDFVYMDPPYAVESRRVFREYGAKVFSFLDVERLGEHLHKLEQKKVKFVVSYADCKESRRIGKDWIFRRLRVRRHVAGFASSRRMAYEVLITNIEK